MLGHLHGRLLQHALLVGCLLGLTACPPNGTTAAADHSVPGGAKKRMAPPSADTLDVGDVLEVKIYGEPELSGPQKVGSDGAVNLPLVGRVDVRGLTAEQSAEAIAAAYSNGYLKSPQVNVVVTAFNSKRFYVLGAVKNPGVFAYEQDMNALRAVVMAGGFAPGASRNSVLITRQVSGQEVRMEVPVDDIGQGKAKNVPVLPGDIIYVNTSIF